MRPFQPTGRYVYEPGDIYRPPNPSLGRIRDIFEYALLSMVTSIAVNIFIATAPCLQMSV